ncbi:MAG: isoamylase early set domain-containing protein [Bacteroidales bacterium]|jgi:1,4-alpha-glucan branching enzyme
MSIKKKYLTDKEKCKVTFSLPAELAENAKSAKVVGEFNNWDPEGSPMKKRSGKFNLTLELESNKEYQFRYLIDGERWAADPEADDQAPSPFENEYNSVVRV